MTEINKSTFRVAMTPGAENRPTTWSDWWYEDSNREIFINGLGIVKKIDENEETDSYGDPSERTMVFELIDCGPPRWFRVVVDASSYGTMSKEPTLIDEVCPERVVRPVWKPV